VTEKGLLKIDNRPGLAVSLERIKELEARVDHMIDICDRCNAVYDELGVTDPHSVDQDPLTRYESARQTLDGAHHAVWQRLEHDHQQSPLAFPSEIISEPSLAAYERQRMDMREMARKEAEFLKAGLHRLDDLFTEARNA
jgi:hypothetical protein